MVHQLRILFCYLLCLLHRSHSQNLDSTNDDTLTNSRTARFFQFYAISPANVNRGVNENSLYHDPPPADKESFDFIVVGSGSAGSALANRLSENPKWKILLLEVGDVATPLSDVPAMAPIFQFTKLDWGYHAEKENGSCWGCPNQRMRWPRGRGLGGTSLINFMIHVRGNPLDYDKWEAMGNPGWGYKDVLPYFKKLEDAKIKIQDTEYRQTGGYMTVSDIPFRTKGAEAFVKAAQEAGYPYVDYNGKDQMGVSFSQGNIRNGFRCSVEKAYLRPIRDRKNLKILTNSRVTKILVDKKSKKAYGVIFVRNRKYYKIKATKEVILSAGAFNSPQLLMLSGIGPKEDLEELEIPVIQDLPVGKKMYDHITFAGLNFIVNEKIIVKEDAYYDPNNLLDLLKNGKGPLTLLGGVEALTFLKTNVSREPLNLPDMELIFVGSNMAGDRGAVFKDTMSISQELYDSFWKELEPKNAYQVLPMLLHPKSYGYLKLKSKNPFKWPQFYPRYFTDEDNQDIKTFIAAIREVIRICDMPSLRKYGSRLYEKSIPGCEKHPFNSDAYWECALRTVNPTLHHQVSTCKMGPISDPEAVVDPRLRVHGVQNLRVADTSVIPTALSAHTNIPAIMVGEKAADIIKKDWDLLDTESRIDVRIG